MTPHILLVEDAADVQMIVRQVLGARARVTVAETGAAAMDLVAGQSFSLILLDVSLPDADGFQICARLRQQASLVDTPIIFLTGRAESREKVLAFSLGADDYVTKPFDPAEFQARVEAKLRRSRQETENRDVFQKNAFRVLLPQQKVMVSEGGRERDLGLSGLEFKLLYFFLRHEEHVLTRDRILDEVWGRETHVTDRVVDTYVYALRRKLGERSGILRSVPRVGYRYSEA